MNVDESLRLYKQGREKWNEWADSMLACRENSKAWKDAARVAFGSPIINADFSGFIFPGHAPFYRVTFNGTTTFEGATFEGAAGFEGAIFTDFAKFEEVTFKGDTTFERATFEGAAEFERATFTDFAKFEEATFKGTTRFKEATFEENVWFWETTFTGGTEFGAVTFKGTATFGAVTFKGAATFDEATFEGAATFRPSTFEKFTSFDGAKFRARADFRAVQGNSEFTMANAEFMEVPDFQQATFVEAPRLDNVNIESRHSRNISFTAIKSFFRGDLEKEGRWRALKRLATQGHDHASEQLFFRGELLARRGVTDRYWHASFWLGVFYQLFSDFGRSLIRPLLWWAVGVLVFAGIYLSHYPRGGEWLTLECIAGTGKPWVSALGLSLHRSLPALPGFRDTLLQFHACLYGVHSESPFRPIIPDVVSFLSVAQVLFSAVMIFLFLLAVRNHFRIK